MPQPNPSVQPKDAPKIIFVRQQFSAFGGAELILDSTMKALSARGQKIGILARSWRAPQKDIEFIPCNPPKIARPLRETIFARAACRTLKNHPHSLVVSQEKITCCDVFRTDDGVHAAFLAARSGEDRLANFLLKLNPYHRNKLALERKMLASERLKGVIAISRMVADDLVRHYAYPLERIHHIPNGIDLDRFHPGVREQYRMEMRRKFGIREDKPVVLFVGTGFDRKGLRTAIESVAKMEDEAELWVVGQDRRPNYFSSLASEAGLSGRYRYFGPQTDPVPWYGSADISVLPSIYEPFGLAALESMACGLPCVVSTNCGAKEVVEQLDKALVCTANVDRTATALEHALKLTKLPGTVMAARSVAEKYSLNATVDRMLYLYERLRT